MSNIYTEKKIDSYSQTDISTQTDNKKKGRPVIYTEEEKLQLRKERNRIYQKIDITMILNLDKKKLKDPLLITQNNIKNLKKKCNV